MNVHFFSDDDSGTMKVLTDTDDEPPPLPPKVSSSQCTYTIVFIDSYSELHVGLLLVKVGINCSSFVGEKGLYVFHLLCQKKKLLI